MTKKTAPSVSFMLLIAAFLTGCHYQAIGKQPIQTPDFTNVFETAEASFASVRTTRGAMDGILSTNPAPTSSVPTQTPTLPPTIIETADPDLLTFCNRAAPGSPLDVEIDDDTEMLPGQMFTKIWRLTNEGSCTWNRGYKAVYFYGEKLGDILGVTLDRPVQPGDSVDIAVDMVAPVKAGVYQSNWMLQSNSGEVFGIGPAGNSPFWVRIMVVSPPTLTPSPTLVPTSSPTPTASPTITPTVTPTPAVHLEDSAVLILETHIDLDSGAINPAKGSDLLYRIDENKMHWLVPEGKTILGIYGGSTPGLKICQTTTRGTAPIAIESLSPGIYLCYKTSEGRTGRLQLTSLDQDDYSIGLDFLTWKEP